MFSKKTLLNNPVRKSEEVKKSAGKVVDPKRDTPTRAKHLRLFLDNAELHEIVPFFEAYYSHVFYIVYDAFITAEVSLRQKGAHKAQREELEAVLYLFEKILIYLPEHLARKWQYHSVGRLMSKLLHPGNSWKLLKREAMRLFLLWYQILGEVAGEPLHAMFATLVPGFPSPYQGLGLTALAAMTPDNQDGPVNPAEICPLIPPQSGERWRSPDTDLTRIFLDVLLELSVTQVTLVEWKGNKLDRQRRCLNFLFEKFKAFYMPHIFPDFSWSQSLYRPSLELPEVRKFRPAFVDSGDGTKKIDPMLSCRVVVIKWVAQYTHITANANSSGSNANNLGASSTTLCDHNMSAMSENSPVTNGGTEKPETGLQSMTLTPYEECTRNTVEGDLVRSILYGCRENVNFVHEVYRQAFLLSFSHSPAIKKVITVYKDWIQMNVAELPPFLLEPVNVDKEREDFMNALHGRTSSDIDAALRENLAVRAGLQNVLQIFITNAANVFLLEVSPEYPILLDEQVELCKRVLNIYRYMVMNVKMEARTWEQLLFILLQITQLTLPETPPRRREEVLGGRLAQAIFQTLIVTWIKANLYVVVSTELWDQFLEVLSSLTLWEELIREWAKTMETLTRVLARQVYHLDLNDLPLDRLSERARVKGGGARARAQLEGRFSTAPPGRVPAPVAAVTAPTLPSPGMAGGNAVVPPPLAHSPSQGVDDGSGAGSIIGPSVSGMHQHRRSPFPLRKRLNSEGKSEGGKAGPRTMKGVVGKNGKKLPLRRSMSDGNMRSAIASIVSLNIGVVGDPDADGHASRRRHRSVDSLQYCSGSSRYSESDCGHPVGGCSRSCSPAPSSGIDVPMPMQLDQDTMSEGGMSNDQNLSHSSASNAAAEPRSVMSGGGVKGWLPDVAVVLWRRMLGALGNINHIADTVIHAQIYKYLIELFEIMVRIRNNQGVSLDNASTPLPPDYVPPFTIFAPWCFRALSLPEAYHRGKLYALRLLCLFTCRQNDTPLPKTHLVQFFKVLHEGLTGNRPDVTHTLLKFTGPRFFSLMLPGYTAYVLDFLFAANAIVSTAELKGVPRTEATSVVGALLSFPSVLSDVPLLLPNSDEMSLISSADVKDQIIGVLLKSGKKEPAGLARCISLSSLGIFVYSELIYGSFHPKIKEAIQVLLTALRFNNKAVAQIASDMLLLLADHVPNFLDFYPEVPKKIVEVLARTLVSLTPRGGAEGSMGDDEKRLLLSLLFCLGEWCMRMPASVLTQPQEDGRSLLYHVFAALQQCSDPPQPGSTHATSAEQRRETANVAAAASVAGRQYATADGAKGLSPAVMAVADFDPNIHVDNTKEGYASNNASPLKSSTPAKPRLAVNGSEMTKCPVRLAARTILSHLVNHLFHFPMGVGAASLSSMVNEHDDLSALQVHDGTSSGDLTKEIFNQPNVQMFILNDTTLLSFVELPALDLDTVPAAGCGIKAADSQVRMILRDISGKFSWDSSALLAPGKSSVEGSVSLDLDTFWPDREISKKISISLVAPPRHLRHRKCDVLPSAANTAADMDNLDDLLQYIGYTSPECLEELGRPLNAVPAPAATEEAEPMSCEKEVISSVLSQRNLEQEHGQRRDELSCGEMAQPPAYTRTTGNGGQFQQCRRLFSSLGLASWERRPSVHLIRKSETVLRELKNLDSKRCREAHKIAVVYVGEGQEDRHGILSNASGSAEYEEFVSGLAWEVELETHAGFLGGLKGAGNKAAASGETAPYYATSFIEAIFHVATRMPSSTDEGLLQKTRHIGNDEIHIVWSEHWRDYRRGILPTEFCDVLIVIYPLKNSLFRVQVSRKPEVPYFGPLFNEAVVDRRVLPGLVRATAINASRAKRSMLTYYQNHYEERFRALQKIVGEHKDASTFEDFVTQVYSPAKLSNLYASSSSSSRPSSMMLSASSSLSAVEGASTMAAMGGGSPFSNSSAADLRSRMRSEAFNNNLAPDDVSPRTHHKKLNMAAFRTASGAAASAVASAVTAGAQSAVKHNRQLSIKEEAGLPASPPPVPTRKR